MLLPLIEGCEQVGWRMVIKFEGGWGTGDEMVSNPNSKRIEKR